MTYTPRTSKYSPTDMVYYDSVNENNKWWYSSAYSTDSGAICLPNCTTYVMGRCAEIAGKSVKNYDMLNIGGYNNATYWYGEALWEKSQTPSVGAVACWSDNGAGWGGHVAVVEETDGTLAGTKISMSGYVSASSGTRSFTNPGTSSEWYFKYVSFNTANSWYAGGNPYKGTFQGFLVNPYVDVSPTPPTPSGKDVIEFTNNSSYAYITFDGKSSESGYDYKLQLVAPYFAKAGNPNSVSDSSMGSDWELVARINGGFFFTSGSNTFANGLEKQHWTWNEQYDDPEYDNVLAIGGDGSDNTNLNTGTQGNMREYGGEWCLTGGISLSGGSYISSAVDSSTGHSFIGHNGTKIIMGISKSGVSGATMRSYISGLGYTGVELDGGGSTVFNYLGTNYSNTYDGRSVKNVICLYKRKKTTYYTVTLNATPSSYGSVSGSGSYSAGSSVTITATPSSKCRFDRWSDGNTSATRTITVNNNVSLTAYFVKTYTVKLSAEPTEGGTVSGSGTYDEGSTITIKATPNKHYRFIKWSDGNTEKERTISYLSNDLELIAYFKKGGVIIKGQMGIDFQVL